MVGLFLGIMPAFQAIKEFRSFRWGNSRQVMTRLGGLLGACFLRFVAICLGTCVCVVTCYCFICFEMCMHVFCGICFEIWNICFEIHLCSMPRSHFLQAVEGHEVLASHARPGQRDWHQGAW